MATALNLEERRPALAGHRDRGAGLGRRRRPGRGRDAVGPFFRTLTRGTLCDTSAPSDAPFALSCDCRAEADEMVTTAVAAAGTHAMDPLDHGFMDGRGFDDLGGHHRGILRIDQEAIET